MRLSAHLLGATSLTLLSTMAIAQEGERGLDVAELGGIMADLAGLEERSRLLGVVEAATGQNTRGDRAQPELTDEPLGLGRRGGRERPRLLHVLTLRSAPDAGTPCADMARNGREPSLSLYG